MRRWTRSTSARVMKTFDAEPLHRRCGGKGSASGVSDVYVNLPAFSRRGNDYG